MTTTWQTALALLKPCADAVALYSTYPTLQAAWDACERGDWMLWYLGRCGVDRRRLVLAACACARLSLGYVPAGEDRPRLAIETAERWARGEERVTLDSVRRAADAAYNAAYAADTAYATAAYAAYAAADAQTDTRRQCAAIVRHHFPHVEMPR